VKLNKLFASKMGADLAILNKERPLQQVAEISYVIGDVKDKTAVIVDDIIGTAGTLKAAATPSGTRAPAASTPPRPRPLLRQRVRQPDRIRIRAGVVTDTVPLPPAPRQRQGALLRRPADSSIRQIFMTGRQ